MFGGHFYCQNQSRHFLLFLRSVFLFYFLLTLLMIVVFCRLERRVLRFPVSNIMVKHTLFNHCINQNPCDSSSGDHDLLSIYNSTAKFISRSDLSHVGGECIEGVGHDKECVGGGEVLVDVERMQMRRIVPLVGGWSCLACLVVDCLLPDV